MQRIVKQEDRRMKSKGVIVFLFLFLLLTVALPVYALDPVGANPPAQPLAAVPETKTWNMMNGLQGFTQSFKSHGGYLDLGMRFGYMDGFTSFDFNHHRSELEYPFNCYLGGGIINLGYKDISMNSQFWGSLVDDPTAGWNMKDKDWDMATGELESDTRSKSFMNAVIWDANLRYDFLKYSFGKKKTDDVVSKSPNIKLGVLIGYRYQRYGYKMDGMYQTGFEAEGEPSGKLILEYKIKYHLPYYGLALEAGGDKFGVAVNAKYAFSPHVTDLDNHVLRSLNFYGDYKKNPNVFMADFTTFWKFFKNWQLNVGADVALIRLDGQVWEDDHDPSWDADQSIDTKQFIYWLGLGYRF